MRGASRSRARYVADLRRAVVLQPLRDRTADHAPDDRRDPEQPERRQRLGPPKIAVAVERAGLSEAFETGIATRWNSVSASPMAIGAKPAGARLDVAPTMTIRNSAVMTTSVSNTAMSENWFAPP